MNEIDMVVRLRDGDADLTWDDIGRVINKSGDAARSIYRRAKGTHTRPEKKRRIDTGFINAERTLNVAFPTDEHYPYQDDRARSVALQIVRDFQPDVLISGSDGMDFYTLSKFNRNPERKATLQDEINLWKGGQREWQSAAPYARRIFIPGNHEDRLRIWRWTHPELADLEAIQLPILLGLAGQGIEYMDEVEFFGRLVIKHGNRITKHSAYTARAELESEKYAVSLMTGHTHRGGTHYATTRKGMVQAHECFCLCSLEPEYVKRPNWQQGIALASVSDLHLSVELIPFYTDHGKTHAFWRDKLYVEE